MRISRKNETQSVKRSGILAGMRIRKKLIVLHTSFSLALALILIVAIRPAIRRVVRLAEVDESKLLLNALGATSEAAFPSNLPLAKSADLRIARGSASELGLPSDVAASAQLRSGEAVEGSAREFDYCAVMFIPADGVRPGEFIALKLVIPEARDAVFRFYVVGIAALACVYALVAIALELFVLPQNVYEPIQRMRDADEAVRSGDRARELIPEYAMPADELGDIMRSRNQTIDLLRNKEKELASALDALAAAATDLQKKNHLLETAQRNLADADRLASLGMMSAGIAHELNTPLAVLKGLVEKLNSTGGGGKGSDSPDRCSIETPQAALMLRVVQRLEKLGDSLLDFARLRPASKSPAGLRALVAESILLVRLDRDRGAAQFINNVSERLVIDCDADRMIQVLVNLLRNGVDAASQGYDGPSPAPVRVAVDASASRRGDMEWVSISVRDNGPGIDPTVLPRLFEPFVSTRMDSKGTGLGLAVAHGIIREHGGMIVARNENPPAGEGQRGGAVFELILPMRADSVQESAVPSVLPDSPAVKIAGGAAAATGKAQGLEDV